VWQSLDVKLVLSGHFHTPRALLNRVVLLFEDKEARMEDGG
jgi:predicted MPP superfamily phosphohydrolase